MSKTARRGKNQQAPIVALAANGFEANRLRCLEAWITGLLLETNRKGGAARCLGADGAKGCVILKRMRTDQHQEIEIKLRVVDEEAIRASLVGLGFIEIVPRGLEQNRIYDTAEGELRARGELIRLREFNGKNVLTYKGRATVGKHKEREEIEVVVGATEAMATILGRLGLEPQFRYEKYRSEWQRPGGEGIVMVDETPIGTFVELEGTGDWIDRTAVELGYTEGDYLNLSYARLFTARCLAEGRAAGNMLFDAV